MLFREALPKHWIALINRLLHVLRLVIIYLTNFYRQRKKNGIHSEHTFRNGKLTGTLKDIKKGSLWSLF